MHGQRALDSDGEARMISHRYATAEDCRRYYGDDPQRTIHAIVILLDDEPAAMIGLERRRDRFVCFSEFKPELEPHLKTMPVLRALKALKTMIHESPLPVIVQNTTNPKLIERLGFIQIQPGVHLCQH
jgi:hypothetical protein